MLRRFPGVLALIGAMLASTPILAAGPPASSGPPAFSGLTLREALGLALTRNPRLIASDRDVGIAQGRRIQAGLYPNPNLAGSYVGNPALISSFNPAREPPTSTLQISQLIELGGKRAARIASASSGLDVANRDREVTRLDVLSATAQAFVAVLGGQRRIDLLSRRLTTLERTLPALRRRVEAGASSPAEAQRGQVAVDLARADLERARAVLAGNRRALAAQWGDTVLPAPRVAGDLDRMRPPPPLPAILARLRDSPRLSRWSSLRAQQEADLRGARAQNVPDVNATLGGLYYNGTAQRGAVLSLSIPLPVFNRNQGTILATQEGIARTYADQAATDDVLRRDVGTAYETLAATRGVALELRGSTIPTARRAADTIRSGYAEGRFTLLELLDAENAVIGAELSEQDALVTYHQSVAIIEGLTGQPLTPLPERPR